MAPRKAASPAKPRRVTRSRAADTDTKTTIDAAPKRKATTVASPVPMTSRTKAIEAKSRVSKKAAADTAKTTKAGKLNARSAKSTPVLEVEDNDEDPIATAAVQSAPKASRSTRTTASTTAPVTSSLAAAPRRRIKVTPLDVVNNEPSAEIEVEAEKKKAAKVKNEKTVASKSTTSRTKKDASAAKLEETADEDRDTHMTEAEPRKRGRPRAPKPEGGQAVDPATETSSTVRKTRGRPRKEDVSTATKMEKVAPLATRQTRARTGSSASAALPESTAVVVVPTRKKVTFQDPADDDDDKENVVPPTLAKSRAAKKAPPSTTASKKAETATKGMRAKPIRKPAVAKTTKATRGAATRTTVNSIKEVAAEEVRKVLPTVLTPKKITQVAKAMPQDSEDEEAEDELSGPKTPVHDLSISPKQKANTPAARSLSPVKKLDFTPALKSPEKSTSIAAGILSPPRRMPLSPLKDSLKESPRRAPEGVTVFRAHIDTSGSTSLAMNPSHGQSVLLHSPKRGLTDMSIFPPSPLKSQNSPLKSTLLSSPARRLFSPSKQKTPARLSPSPKKIAGGNVTLSGAQSESPGDADLVMSSHFRASASPERSARVYRLSEDELARETGGLDFDQSVLNIASPWKVDKVKPGVDTTSVDLELGAAGRLDQIQERLDGESMIQATETSAGIDPERITTLEADEETILDAALEADEEETILDAALEADEDETILDPALELEDVEETDVETEQDSPSTSDGIEPDDAEEIVEKSAKRTRVSNTRFNRIRELDDESEDELAADQTPANRVLRPSFRPSMSNANIRSRLSTGVAPLGASKGLGFTPLATQVGRWRAASPVKRALIDEEQTASQGVFSPVAQLHVNGSVEVNRQLTPVQQARKRKSLANRLSFAPSMTGSPAGPDFFGEGMAALDFEAQIESQDAPRMDEDLHDLEEPEIPEQVDSAVDSEEGSLSEDGETETLDQEAGELTTDLIKFTNASDTAMVDFQALADEAQEIATHEEAEEGLEPEPTSPVSALQVVDEEQSMLSTSSEVYGDENAAPVEEQTTELLPEIFVEEIEDDQDSDSNDGNLTGIAISTVEADSILEGMDFNVTPVRPDPSLPRYVNTVVSKVPLRPEGQIPIASSPLKAHRKRPRSLSSSYSLAVKRRSLGADPESSRPAPDFLATPKAKEEFGSSPQRRIRSAAPSPANSLATGITTPGEMSFAIDDFGDSTLDGIELPEDMFSDEVEASPNPAQEGEATRDISVLSIGSALFKTPTLAAKRSSIRPSTARTNKTANASPSTTRTNKTANETPSYAAPTTASRRRSMTTPSRTNTAAGTPSTLLKSKRKYKATPGRTPLKLVGQGLLHGATVHYDIHTSEGSDASAFYVELLTAMGARCIKEWRWNSRASISLESPAGQHEAGPVETPSAGVGITHVVYKDGGKRTLEKVCAAKGQVLCVGVSWVLDCYREQKWLDEAPYAVDATIMPRGGSRRRKSMEPRMLVNENGSLSTSRENRLSWSGDQRGALEESKTDVNVDVVRTLAAEDETEISSTYNSPAAATVGGGGDTANLNLGYLFSAQVDADADADADAAASPRKTPRAVSKRADVTMTTPQSTSLAVDYDPRTAATPLTPYVMARGRGLVQMSAPPKQVNKGIFDGDDEDNGGDASTGANKFQLKAKSKESATGNGNANANANANANTKAGLLDARRKTLGATVGFKPVVASPLRRG